MRDLTDLPAELLNEILSLAFGVASRYGYEEEDAFDIKALSRLLFLNRKHYLKFLPLFFRTAVRNPDLVSTVKVVKIGNWGLCAPFYLDRNRELQDQDEELQFTADDEETVQTAFQRSGLSGDLASQISDAIFADRREYRDRRPLMVLLLTCLPCVWKVYAHIPASDPFLGAVLQTAIDRQRTGAGRQLTWLPSLEEFHVLCETPGNFERRLTKEVFCPTLNLDDIWPILYLKGLRTLRLYDFDPDGFSQLFYHKMYSRVSECHIEHLHIATKRKSICRAEDITALLTLPVGLKSLSFSWDSDNAKIKEKINGKRRNVWQISNNEFWTTILKYKGTLEYLDVWHDFPSEPYKRRPTDYFGPLTEFTQLRYLSIIAEMLIGGYIQGWVAPFRLKEALPASLETLVFATRHTGETISDLPFQVEEAVSQFHRLKTLEFTDYWLVGGHFPRGTTPAKYQPLKEACFRNGVRFGIQGPCKSTFNKHCPFPRGARCLSRWKETYIMRVDGRRRHMGLRKRYPQSFRTPGNAIAIT